MFLGTSKAEEETLRAAATAPRENRLLYVSTDPSALSAYETASEFGDEPYDDTLALPNDSLEQESDDGDNDTIEFPQEESAQTPRHSIMDDENLIESMQRYLPFDPTGMTENELNRVGIERSERGESLIPTKTLTTATHIDVRDLDYDDDNDPASPFNWPTWKKWFVTLVIANVCLCVSLGSSLYVSAVPELIFIHHSLETLTISGLSFYLLGLGLGPTIAAPISEIIGRRWIYLISFTGSMLFAMGVGLSKNMREILVLRFFGGFIGSPPMALAGGTIADIWSNDPKDLALAMYLFCLCPFLGIVIGPIVGGFAAQEKNWQWTMWVYLMFCGAVLPCLLLCPETFKPAILASRAKKRNIAVVKPKFSLKETLIMYLGRPLEMLVVEPIVCFTSIYIAFVFAILFCFFEAFPIIFRGVYGMSMGISGLTFIGVGLGLMLGVVVNLARHARAAAKKARAHETGEKIPWDEPEAQLFTVKVGSVFLPISLFWLAWTSRKSIHWIVPTLAGVPFGFGLMGVFLGIISYYAFAFPPIYVASAISANNLLRFIVAAVFPLFVLQMYSKLHIDWATSLFAFIALAMVPIPFLFDIYGERLRLNSKYGYVALFKKLAEEKERNQAQELTKSISATEDKSLPLTSSQVADRV
ncbi:MFS general substrate transporter [Metschnikowia bicuspidata]|uniref:MFS general substrate transporter n=1 Tax=Metschnikowia bicuspidata TaxID=27322 RepID=A0A4P9ZCR4_9ASCO|nr:MFS general substrate transporter [Metschnikowia bicuspidata]